MLYFLSLQIDNISNILLLFLKAYETELEESKDPESGETAEGRGVAEMEKKEEVEVSTPEQGGEEDVGATDTDKPDVAASKPAEGEPKGARHDQDKPPTDAGIEDTEATNENKDGETGGDREGIKEKNDKKQESIKEGKETKDVSERAAEGAEKKNQVQEEDAGEMKDKQKIREDEKQGKPKRKSGPPSSFSRPRPSARSVRASAKNDIIAKFQRGAPE